MPLETLRKENKTRASPGQEESIPPEIKTRLIKEFLDDHYRHWKDSPLPAFGGLTPRQAANDPAQRGALIEVLKDMESIEERQRKSGKAVYGAARLRAELGV